MTDNEKQILDNIPINEILDYLNKRKKESLDEDDLIERLTFIEENFVEEPLNSIIEVYIDSFIKGYLNIYKIKRLKAYKYLKEVIATYIQYYNKNIKIRDIYVIVAKRHNVTDKAIKGGVDSLIKTLNCKFITERFITRAAKAIIIDM